MTDPRHGADLVHRLLVEQHPDLAGLPLREVAGGWDNQLWRLGDELAVRLPRTDRAPGLLRQEQRWLPQLASRLPLPVPVPERVGEPSPTFAQPWGITRWVPGTPADRAPVTDVASARVWAGFLRALHQTAPREAPRNPARGMPLREVPFASEEMFDVVADHPQVDRLRSIWREAVAAPDWDGPPLWLHGDLHPANVVTRDGALFGVLDFGDMGAGDPATDLCSAWLLLPGAAVAPALDAYGRLDPATTARARGWGVLRAVGLVGIGVNGRRGLPGGKPSWEPAGLAALERILRVAG